MAAVYPWALAWTGQPPAPPDTFQANGLTTLLVRVNGAGPWVAANFPPGVADQVLKQGAGPGGSWGPVVPGPPFDDVLLGVAGT